MVSSELQEDYFLSTITPTIFEDTEGDIDSEDSTYTETVFETSCGDPLSITLEHCVSSSVDLVGLQVWRGAFLLADYLLSHPDLFVGRKVIELAAGTGLTSVTAATMASHVTATDVDRGDILPLLQRNGERNSKLMTGCKWNVQEVDFFWDTWTEELESVVLEGEIVLAADVVYDKDITKHFFKTLVKVLSFAPKVAFIAIEKRQRTGDEGALIAPNFEYFQENLEQVHLSRPRDNVMLKVTREETDFQQFFKYSRVLELTLWKVESVFS